MGLHDLAEVLEELAFPVQERGDRRPRLAGAGGRRGLDRRRLSLGSPDDLRGLLAGSRQDLLGLAAGGVRRDCAPSP